MASLQTRRGQTSTQEQQGCRLGHGCPAVGVDSETPRKTWHERPCAFVELKDGAKATEAEIIAFCRSHMSGFKTPKAVVFGPIPKTSTGKIQKFMLRTHVESAKAISA